MIVTVGSINMDLVVRVSHHPEVGETTLGSDYEAHPGGKGANQAVAASRIGAPVRMLGAVGNDSFGPTLLKNLEAESIDVSWLKVVDLASGIAFICVDQEGKNTIVVAPGANGSLTPNDVSPDAFVGANVILLQLEIPLSTVREAARLGKQVGATVILNAAPASKMTNADYENIDVLVVNEIEAGMLLNRRRAKDPAEAIDFAAQLARFVPAVIVTLGNLGAVWKNVEGEGHQRALEIDVVDTTAAGDAFVGTLAVALGEGFSLKQAVTRANAAGALAATKLGAQPSLPTGTEIDEFMVGIEK